MSDLPHALLTSPLSHYPGKLRASAEALLQTGNTPVSLGYVLSPDALAVLMKLASAPDSDGDGLKLLHELQTHQIELDLQYEQMRSFERETSAELAYYKALYESAPTGYLVINRAGRVLQSNLMGANLLGLTGSELDDCMFEHHLAPASRTLFRRLLHTLASGGPAASCIVHTGGPAANGTGSMRALRVVATVAPASHEVLLNISALESPASA